MRINTYKSSGDNTNKCSVSRIKEYESECKNELSLINRKSVSNNEEVISVGKTYYRSLECQKQNVEDERDDSDGLDVINDLNPLPKVIFNFRELL